MENDAIESAKQILPTFTEEDIYVLSPSLVSLIRRTLKIDMEPLPKYLSSARQLMRVMLEVHLHDLNAPLVMLERCNSEADFEAVVRMCYDYLLLTPRLSHQEIRNICQRLISQQKDCYLIIQWSNNHVKCTDDEPQAKMDQFELDLPKVQHEEEKERQLQSQIVDSILERKIKAEPEEDSSHEFFDLISKVYKKSIAQMSNLDRKQLSLPHYYLVQHDSEEDEILLEMAAMQLTPAIKQQATYTKPTSPAHQSSSKYSNASKSFQRNS